MARNSLLCADVPLRNYSLTHSLTAAVFCDSVTLIFSFLHHTTVYAVFVRSLFKAKFNHFGDDYATCYI